MMERATWIKYCRGGYGTATAVPVVVLHRGPKRVRVLVPVRPEYQPRMGVTVKRSVDPSSLRPRAEHDPIDDCVIDLMDALKASLAGGAR